MKSLGRRDVEHCPPTNKEQNKEERLLNETPPYIAANHTRLKKHPTRTIIASNKTVSVLGLELAILILLRLLHGNVHEPIETGQDALVLHAIIKLHVHGATQDALEKIRRRLLFRRHHGQSLGRQVPNI